MKRFRVYDKWLHETLEQSDTNDYSYRDRENMWICDITDALEDPARFVVQENTEIKDIRNRYIFAGDQIGFTEDVFGLAVSRKGTVVRGDTGMWQVMVDETIPFGLYHIKDRVILGHINEGFNMKTLYQLDIKLPEKGFSLYRIAIEKLLKPIEDPWEIRKNGFTLEISILTTPKTIDTLRYEIGRETGIEVK